MLQLEAREFADLILRTAHRIPRKPTRDTIAVNLSIYIAQAHAFYIAASAAPSNTAPLFFYYSYLHLAKAACEVTFPKFHQKPESYSHGLSWRPNTRYLVDPATDSVHTTRPGVWHLLFEALTGVAAPRTQNLTFRIRDLMALCPEISIEYARTFGSESRLVWLLEPNMLWDPPTRESWIRFSVARDELKRISVTRAKVLDLLSSAGFAYRAVKSPDPDLWALELARPVSVPNRKVNNAYKILEDQIRAINPFTTMEDREIHYAMSIQDQLPYRLPQLLVLYAISFWLGSLVRYDPHSVKALQDSRYWTLIDGFLDQSTTWLLELFEWNLFRTETTLVSAR